MRRTLVATLLLVASLLAATPVSSAPPKPPARPVGYEPGMVAPDLKMLTANGTAVQLSSLRGKYVVLDISTIWCGPSQFAARGARALVDTINQSGVFKEQFTWVTLEMEGPTEGLAPTPKNLVDFANRYDLGDRQTPVMHAGAYGSKTYLAAGQQLVSYATANDLGAPGWPTMVVIDPSGVILDVVLGFSEIDVIKEILAPELPYLPQPSSGPRGDWDLPAVQAESAHVELTASGGVSGGADVLPFEPMPLGTTEMLAQLSTSTADRDVVGIDVFMPPTGEFPDLVFPPLPINDAALAFSVTWSDVNNQRFSVDPETSRVRLYVKVIESGVPRPEQLVETDVPVGADGTVASFSFADELAAFRAQLEADGVTDYVVEVTGINVDTRWDGVLSAPVPNNTLATFGRK